jgi:hypothetical protein
MEAMPREWTDDRLDVLNERVALGFKLVDERFAGIDKRFEQIDKRFEKVDAELLELRGEMKEMRRAMTQGVLGLAGLMLTGFIGLFTLIVATSI